MWWYHLTDHDKVDSIMHKGFLPSIGGNGVFAYDTVPSVYFAAEEDIKFWEWLLDRDTLIRFKINEQLQFEYYSYWDYAEFVLHESVPARHADVVPMFQDQAALYCLQRNAIADLSERAHQLTHNRVSKQYSLGSVFAEIKLAYRLNLTDIPAERINKILDELNDEGSFTYLDPVEDTSTITTLDALKSVENKDLQLASEMVYDVLNAVNEKARY